MLRSDHEALRRLRQSKGHSGRTLSEVSGVSQPRICELEAKPTPILPMTAKRLADALGVEIENITTITTETAEEMAS